jgi:hypothetical protein
VLRLSVASGGDPVQRLHHPKPSPVLRCDPPKENVIQGSWLLGLFHRKPNLMQENGAPTLPRTWRPAWSLSFPSQWLIGGDHPQWASSPPQGVNNWRLWWATHAVGSGHSRFVGRSGRQQNIQHLLVSKISTDKQAVSTSCPSSCAGRRVHAMTNKHEIRPAGLGSRSFARSVETIGARIISNKSSAAPTSKVEP